MKKLLSALFITAAFTYCHAQGVIFKIKYLPKHNYQVSGSSIITINSDLSNVPPIANQLAAQGFTEPVTAIANIQLTGNTLTGAPGADSSVPYNMNFNISSLNVTVNGKPIPIPMNSAVGNVKLYGHINEGTKISVDSVNGKKVADSVAAKTMGMMNNMFKMITFPDHPLNVGDSFTQQMPLNLPMGGKGFDINVKITYKLVSTDGAKAYFDVVQDINMQMNIKDKGTVSIIGGGAGKMVYDIANNFPLSFNSDATMKVDANIATMDIKANVSTKSNMNYVISAQ